MAFVTVNGVTHTWHHHQDRQGIGAVPTAIHNNNFPFDDGYINKGFPHSGGASLLRANLALKGFFLKYDF